MQGTVIVTYAQENQPCSLITNLTRTLNITNLRFFLYIIYACIMAGKILKIQPMYVKYFLKLHYKIIYLLLCEIFDFYYNKTFILTIKMN